MHYYPNTYHLAVSELVAFGASRPERAPAARKLIAQALRDMRNRHGRQVARNERVHMLFISGHFPDKP